MMKVKQKKKVHFPPPLRNLGHITWNGCGGKDHCIVNSKCSTQAKLKEDTEAFRNMKNVKDGNKNAYGGVYKTLVDVKYTSSSLMVGIPTKEWYNIPYPVLIFCQTLSQAVLQMESNIDWSQE